MRAECGRTHLPLASAVDVGESRTALNEFQRDDAMNRAARPLQRKSASIVEASAEVMSVAHVSQATPSGSAGSSMRAGRV